MSAMIVALCSRLLRFVCTLSVCYTSGFDTVPAPIGPFATSRRRMRFSSMHAVVKHLHTPSKTRVVLRAFQ
ncbi:hypothetical protein OH76DRAFT_1197664 [Lentinus brumalis]|uniref:Secreted protein n=1 Tax=Lentinus brumalis TaxID=2498619 RepID=A0A371CTD9_9APHY|nr:hypothetical protein OH76DRAFT_1197664 [Polyporus brumalis]